MGSQSTRGWIVPSAEVRSDGMCPWQALRCWFELANHGDAGQVQAIRVLTG